MSLRGDNAQYHLWLGRAYGQKAAEIGNPLTAANLARKAKAEFERAVVLDPHNVSARADLSEYYVEAPVIMGGGLGKARNQASEMQNLDPAAADWIRAIALEKEKKYSDAENSLRSAVSRAQNPAQYWMSLASFYRERGRLDEMQAAIDSALGQSNRPPVTYYAASELLHAGRNFPAAAQYVKTYCPRCIGGRRSGIPRSLFAGADLREEWRQGRRCGRVPRVAFSCFRLWPRQEGPRSTALEAAVPLALVELDERCCVNLYTASSV